MNTEVNNLTRAILIAGYALGVVSGCDLISPVSSVLMVRQADIIVIAVALGQDAEGQPRSVNGRGESKREQAAVQSVPTGRLDQAYQAGRKVAFQVREVLKGHYDERQKLVLPGDISKQDEFNEGTIPYSVVRRSGRNGSCYADSYKAGSTYLLFLKYREGGMSTAWYPLGPTNEQLHSSEDAWLKWVRGELRAETRH